VPEQSKLEREQDALDEVCLNDALERLGDRHTDLPDKGAYPPEPKPVAVSFDKRVEQSPTAAGAIDKRKRESLTEQKQQQEVTPVRNQELLEPEKDPEESHDLAPPPVRLCKCLRCCAHPLAPSFVQPLAHGTADYRVVCAAIYNIGFPPCRT
jgi:hypothetical protein